MYLCPCNVRNRYVRTVGFLEELEAKKMWDSQVVLS